MSENQKNVGIAPEVDAVVSFWGVGAIKKEHTVEVLGTELKLNLTWADGMVGVIPVFESNEAAKKYAGETLIIFELELKGKD